MLYTTRLFVLAATIAVGIFATTTSAATSPRVRIDSGELIGVAANGVDAFKGIPYAAPPVGDLRWRAPRPPHPWTAPRSAEDYGHSCPQHSPPERVAPSSQGATTSEDCLTLNVWTTLHSQRLMPVMVWIHGGGNNAGTSAQTYYDGSAFARDGVVLVSFNYRLGALGFLTHPDIPGANFGLLDQLAALEWVKRNIKAFDGDPNNVTVFGESAGGLDILMLMTSRKAAGQFNRAIVESAGIWNGTPTLPEAQKAGAAIATKLGAPTVAQLRALPADAFKDIDEPGPVIDHDLLTAWPNAPLIDVPLIIGTNNNEGSLLAPDTPDDDVIPELSSADLDTLRSLYSAANSAPAAPVGSLHLAPLLFRDAHFSMPARWFAAREAAGAPAYLYRFDYVASFLRRHRTAANHGSEMPFVFATWPDFRLTAADQQMTRTLHGCWVAFAKLGKPVCPDAPPWPAFSVGSDIWMRFGEPVTPQPVSDRPVLNFLLERLEK
jgi:para-nitrobenzyl esterase